MANILEFFKFIFCPQMLIYSVPLTVMLAYWLFFVLGVTHIDSIDTIGNAIDGTADAADAVADAAVDGTADAAADQGLDSIADAVVDPNRIGLLATADVSAEITAGTNLPDRKKPGFSARILRYLHFGVVPATIIISVMVLLNWLLGFLGLIWFDMGKFYASYPFIEGSARFIITSIVTVILTGKLSNPLYRLFGVKTTHAGIHIIGAKCRIKSSVVNENFGEGEMTIDGAYILISIRSKSGKQWHEGEIAVISSFDEENMIYYI